MKSSDSFYDEKLDHLRALAVFVVFFWHFVHGTGRHPLVAFDYAPPDLLFPLSLFEQGHAGVALFMVLSGYLFAKIVGDRTLFLGAFYRNRALRLLPVLSVVVLPGLFVGVETPASLLSGFLSGWQADGTWSVAVEIQFYLLLPLILWIGGRRLAAFCLAGTGAAIAYRWWIWSSGTDIRDAVTFSLLGRIDNFLIGVALAAIERRDQGRSGRVVAAGIVIAFLVLYHLFNRSGGLVHAPGSIIWLLLPTLESVGFAALIHLYVGTRLQLPRRLGRAVAMIGEASYSIYLLHFAIVMTSARHVHDLVGPSPRAWLVALLSLPVFALCCLIGYGSYLAIEKPFLRRRVPYLGPARVSAQADRSSGGAASGILPPCPEGERST